MIKSYCPRCKRETPSHQARDYLGVVHFLCEVCGMLHKEVENEK